MEEDIKKITGKEKKDKSYLVRPLLFIAIMIVVMVIAFVGFGKSGGDLASVISSNQDILLSDIKSGDFTASKNLAKIKSITDMGSYIDYSCGSIGTQDSLGVYYLKNGEPTDVESGTWEKQGEGFILRNGANSIYLEKIADNFYYYTKHEE